MNPLIKVPIKFGFIGAAVLILIFLVYYFMGSNPLIEMDMIDVFILPVFLFFGIKEYRDTFNNRLLEFWQGMTCGFIIYTVIAILPSLFTWFFVDIIDVSLAEDYIADRLDILAQNKDKIFEEMGEDTYRTSVSKVGATTVYELALDSFLKKLAIGFLLTTFISLILKKGVKN